MGPVSTMLSKDIDHYLTNKATWLAEIVRQELYIDVMAPPKNTGLLPLTYTDATQDAARLQAIFDYIKANEYTYYPEGIGHQQAGYTYKLKFPSGVLTLAAQVAIKGQFIRMDGDGTVIKTTHREAAFKSSGSDARKLRMKGFQFPNVETALEQDNTNIDTCMLNFYECEFKNTTGVAVKIKNQSAMAYFSRCSWYHCRYIFESVILDQCVFDDCWFSEAPRQNSFETSFILRGNYTKLTECFLIPSGYDRFGDTTGESSMTDLAWIAAYGNVEITGCRISSEPNSKTLVNSYVTASDFGPYEPKRVVVKNNHLLSAAYGECIVRLFDVPNLLEISGNGFVRYNDLAIKYGTGFDINTWLAAHPQFTNEKILIILDDNTSQTKANSICPPELRKFLRWEIVKASSTDYGIISRSTNATSAKKGTFSNTVPYFDITTNVNTNQSDVFPNTDMYMIKMVVQPSNDSVTDISHFLGILSFTVGRYGGVLSAKAFLTPLVKNQGGSITDQGSPVTVTATFIDTGTDTTPIFPGSTVKYSIRITWTSAIFGATGKYTYKEVMDGAFLI